MKSAIFALLLFAMPLHADEDLVAEVLERIDVKALTEASLVIDDDTLRNRVLLRLDYDKLAEETFAPLIRETFKESELRELVAYLKSEGGQKFAELLPKLVEPKTFNSSKPVAEAIEKANDDIDREAKEGAAPEKLTMIVMRNIASAVESYATDHNAYPIVVYEQLGSKVVPAYILEIPVSDAWGTPFFYVSDGTSYRFVSAGADRRFQWDSRQLDERRQIQTDNLEADIIFSEGNFMQYPTPALPRQAK